MVGRLLAWLSGTQVRGALVAVGVFCLMLAGQGLASPGAGVVKVRFGGDQKSTRIVVELERSATGKVLGDDPQQVVVALKGVASEPMGGRGQGLVRDWQTGQHAGGAKIELNLSRPAAIKRRFLLPPADGVKVYRYVIDLEATGAPPVAAAPERSGERRPEMIPTRERRDGKRVVVLDAGHGGNDPGSLGAGHKEKALTLAAARTLRDKLERTGRYRVIMTRNSDTYVAHDTRVAIARRADADLFISLHADSGTDRTLRGASVYTLSERGAARAARKFAGGDWMGHGDTGGDPAVTRILLDLTQRATTNRSAVFAKVLLEKLNGRTVLLRRSHRDAGFAVLLAPDVPAVLLEMGFITNPEDERQLADPKRRDKFMAGVVEAVDAYFEGQSRYAGVVGGL